MGKIYWDLEQRSEEWYQLRHSSIGGSELKSLFVKDLVGSDVFYTSLSERMEDFTMDDDAFISKDMMRGIELEPDAIFAVQLKTTHTFEDCGLVKHGKFDFMHTSPDGLTEDSKVAVEVKCPTAKVHVKYILNDIVPEEYVYQIVSYFTNIDDLEKMYFASYRPENISNPLFCKEITLDTELIIGWTRAKAKTKTKEAEPKQPIYETVANLVKEANLKAEQLDVMLIDAITKIKKT